MIAKQRRLGPSGSLVERTAYEAVFPRLPVPALQYFGFVQDEDPQLGWLFLEDAGRTQYSAWLDEHRALAGRWLACLHCYGPDADQTRQLPDYTSARYLDYLQAAHDAILIGLSNPVLTANDTDLLRSMVRLLGRLGSRWNDVEDLSGQLPLTLALRNFVPRNSLIRSDERSLRKSGLGEPSLRLGTVSSAVLWPRLFCKPGHRVVLSGGEGSLATSGSPDYPATG